MVDTFLSMSSMKFVVKDVLVDTNPHLPPVDSKYPVQSEKSSNLSKCWRFFF